MGVIFFGGGDFFLGGGIFFYYRAVYSTVAVQYSTIQYSTIQYNTVQYSTIQYNTVQYTVQYSTVPPNPQSWWCGEGYEGEGEEKVHLKIHGSTSGDRG